MEEKILEFIKRRFPVDQNWTKGNCYFFALILKSVFFGDIVYDTTAGHFMFLGADGTLYDWNGKVEKHGHIVMWEEFDFYDSAQKQRIIKDCIE